MSISNNLNQVNNGDDEDIGGGRCSTCYGNPYFLKLNIHYSRFPTHRPHISNQSNLIDSQQINDDEIENDNDHHIDLDQSYQVINSPLQEPPQQHNDVNVDIPSPNLDLYFDNEEYGNPVQQQANVLPNGQPLPLIPEQHHNHLLVYFNGTIPSELERYHINNPEIRQSANVISGLCNPPDSEYSQYYVILQENLMKEVFNIDNMHKALSSGHLEDFIQAVKVGYHSRTLTRKEEMWNDLHDLFDSSSLSDIEKRNFLIFLAKYGLDVPDYHDTLRKRFINHVMKALPTPILERVHYPPNWNIPPDFEPLYHLRYGILSSIVLHVTNPFVSVLSNKEDIHYVPFVSTDPNGTNYVDHPMNAKYARRMYMRASKLPGFKKETNLVWGLTVYCDGMNTDKFSNRKFLPVYGLLDCYGPNINNKHIGKINFGLIAEFDSTSERIDRIISQSGEPGLLAGGGNDGRRIASMKSFKLELQHIFFQNFSREHGM